MISLVESSRILVSICAPFRGGSPGFTPVHVLEALRVIAREPTGRLGLSSRLGIGESSARTLIERLEEHGLARRSRLGVIITERGLELLKSIESSVKVFNLNLGELGWSEASLLVVRGFKPPRDLVDVYKVRDYIVAEGCREVIIGGFSGGVLSYPGMPEDIKRVIASKLPGDALEEGVLHLIVPSSKLKEVINGVIKMLAELKTGI